MGAPATASDSSVALPFVNAASGTSFAMRTAEVRPPLVHAAASFAKGAGVSDAAKRLFAMIAPAGTTPRAAGGAPASEKSARCAAVIAPAARASIVPSAISHCSRMIAVPARSSLAGRVSANGSNARARASSYR